MLPGKVYVVNVFGRDPAYPGHVVCGVWLAVHYTRQKADGEDPDPIRSVGVRRQQGRILFYLDPSSSRTSHSIPLTGCSPTSTKPPGTSTLPFSGSPARTVTRALPSRTRATPTAGAELRYHDRPHSGHVTPLRTRASRRSAAAAWPVGWPLSVPRTSPTPPRRGAGLRALRPSSRPCSPRSRNPSSLKPPARTAPARNAQRGWWTLQASTPPGKVTRTSVRVLVGRAVHLVHPLGKVLTGQFFLAEVPSFLRVYAEVVEHLL